MKTWFLIKKGKFKIWCLLKWWKRSLHKKSDNFKFLMFFSLDIRAWSTETQTNVVLLLYSCVLTHSTPFVSLYTHWKYLKLSFFNDSRGYRKRHEVSLRTFKSTPSQMFLRISVLKNFATFKGKKLSWSLFLIKSQTPTPANFLKTDSNSGVSLWILRNF